jgi:solute carrier family 7 (L-type amino acid transporter), member 9/15
LAVLFLLVGDIAALIEFASFLIWFFYGAAMVALLVMRKTHSHVPRPYKVPNIFPIFTLLVSVFLVVTPIISEPDIKYLSALGFIFSGVAVYIPFVYMKKRPKIMNKLTHIIQLFFLVAPTNEVDEKML